MLGNELRLDGLAELRKQLLALPADLVREAAVIVQAQAEATEAQIRATYQRRARRPGTGGLQNGLRVETSRDPASASARVSNNARHAYIYERGTPPRRWANGKNVGRMPRGNVFAPIAIQRRLIMRAALVDLVRRAGLDVTT